MARARCLRAEDRSLRRHYPDQVRWVGANHASQPFGTPTDWRNLVTTFAGSKPSRRKAPLRRTPACDRYRPRSNLFRGERFAATLTRMHRQREGSCQRGLSKGSAIGHRASRRRRGREAEGTRLLNEHTPQGYRGFESLRLRHLSFPDIPVLPQIPGVTPRLLAVPARPCNRIATRRGDGWIASHVQSRGRRTGC